MPGQDVVVFEFAQLVRQLVEGINDGRLEVLDAVADASFAWAARQ